MADIPFKYARRHLDPHGWATGALNAAEGAMLPGTAPVRSLLNSETYRQFQDYAKPENSFEYVLNAAGEQMPDAGLAVATGGTAAIPEAVESVLGAGILSGLARRYFPENRLLDAAVQVAGGKAPKAWSTLANRGGKAARHELARDVIGDMAKKGVTYSGESAAGNQAGRPELPGASSRSLPSAPRQERQFYLRAETPPRAYAGSFRDGKTYPLAPAWPGGRVSLPLENKLGQWEGAHRSEADVADDYIKRAGGDLNKAIELLKKDGLLY
jgi:hypothetical protein